MKILFLLPDYFPKSGACTSLLNNLLSAGDFKRLFSQIDAFTYQDKAIGISQERYGDMNIYRAGVGSGLRISQCINLIAHDPLNALLLIAKKIRNKFRASTFEYAINYEIVDEIEQYLYQIPVEQYDIIVPIVGHLEIMAATARAKKRFADVKMVIYQVDPCASNEIASISTQGERILFEREVFKLADHVITTPILLKEAQTRYTDDILSKMSAMEFPNVVPRCISEPRDTDKSIRCVFAGNIYGNIRNPQYTFSLFKDAGDAFQLELIGDMPKEDIGTCRQNGIKVHGRKPLDETRRELERADILVNIGNSMRNQVPSKLFEYISYGKPIVNICKNRDCPTCDYLALYPYALNLYEEADILDEQRSSLRQFVEENYAKRLTPETIIQIYEACTPEYCSAQMLRIFENVLATKG